MPHRSRRWLGCIAVVIALFVVGCQSHKPPMADPEANTLRDHVIAVDSDGIADDPVKQTQTAQADPHYDLDAQLDRMFRAMDGEHAEIETRQLNFRWPTSRGATRATTHGTTRSTDADNDLPVRRILIFVHGGMNEPAEALSRAAIESAEMKKAGSDYYPIFIDWNSGLQSSYGEHLTDVRRGQKDHNAVIAGKAISPIVFIADACVALGRAPLLWCYQLERDASTDSTVPSALSDDAAEKTGGKRHQEVLVKTRALQDSFARDPHDEIQISTGDEMPPPASVLHTAGYFAALPFNFATSPILDCFGTPAWDNMSRRTQIMFEGATLDVQADGSDPAAVLNHPPGAVQHFAERLTKHIADNKTRYNYQITVIGHSMGTMVLNEFLRRNPKLPYDNIVYMAAACSVRDFSKSVVPVMTRNRNVKFYNLCLHPTADLRETHYVLPPRGSLLVWIDDYFANPATPLDRTMGRWDNIVESSYVIPDQPSIKRRVTLKAFALRPKDDLDVQNPQQHGHFRYCAYWEESFWEATPNAAVNQKIAVHATRIEQRQNQKKAPTTQKATVQQFKMPSTTPAED